MADAIETADPEVADPALQDQIAELADEDPFLAGDPGLGDFISQSPGLVVDPAVAREAPCVGYQLRGEGAEPDLVFVKGVVGALDQDQVQSFCSEIEVRDLSPEQRERLAAFSEAAEVCKAEVADLPSGTDPGDKLPAYLGCMGTALRERGQKL